MTYSINSIMHFLKDVYILCSNYETDDALDFVFMCIDDLLMQQRFIDVDRIISCIEIEKLDTAVMLAFLTITHTFKNQIPCRQDFYDEVKNYLAEKDPERVEDLLRGLE